MIPRSSLADVMRSVVAIFATIASRGAWAAGQTYAAGDIVSSGDVPYVCYSPGTSALPAPTGIASQEDGGGVGWRPLIYVGERYIKETGAPPRILLVRGNGKGRGPLAIGDGSVGALEQSFTAYVWGSESTDDLARYDALDALVDTYANAIQRSISGRYTWSTINPSVTSNILTLGEELQIVVSYARQIPLDRAIANIPANPDPPTQSPPNPDQPGTTGLNFSVSLTTNPTRP